jgi:hypothetical protein
MPTIAAETLIVFSLLSGNMAEIVRQQTPANHLSIIIQEDTYV